MRHKDGHWIWILDRGKVSTWTNDGEPLVMSGTHQDISARKLMQEQLHQLAFHDPLTMLSNRRLFNDRLRQTIAANKRSGCYGAVVFLDLDNFKPLNDQHEREVGDMLLIEVANRFKRSVREMDTVARFDGDEFVVLVSTPGTDHLESKLQATIVAEKIRIALSEPYLLSINRQGKSDTIVEHHCTASVGVTLFVSSEASADDVIKCADAAMYEAKEVGRNLIRFANQMPGGLLKNMFTYKRNLQNSKHGQADIPAVLKV
jgi:diguanylate cyclase (GGDEF)-like protein